MLLLVWLLAMQVASAADLPVGQIIDRVTCAADSSQSYSLFVPATYTPSRVWPVILAFDAGGRGRAPVERYQAAAERYGYIVVGSNNSRNGSTEIPKILAALTRDVSERLAVDPRRVYLAGMSGGARVALQVALASKDVAGVIASSAGYPDNKIRKTLPFPIFATAGTEDFNHLEMRKLDAALTSPHRLAIFKGGHVWLPSELAIEAVEWMELQAMKTGLKPRDETELNRMFASRSAGVANETDDLRTFLALRALVDDFVGLRDVTAFEARVKQLGADPNIRDAIKQEQDDDRREEGTMRDIASLEGRLTTDGRVQALAELRQRWKTLSAQAKNPVDSSGRQLARRVLSALTADARSIQDADYQQIIAEYRLPRAGI
jgi:predicted esterase